MTTQEIPLLDSRARSNSHPNEKWTSGAKYLCIVLLLLAAGIAGHQTHWNFGITNHEKSASGEGRNEVAAGKPIYRGWEIQFPSEKSMQRSGVKTAPIQQRPIVEHIKATGVVTYDERMSASLSARVPGTVWRVLKRAGDAVRQGEVLVIVDAAEVGIAKGEFLSSLVTFESKSEVLDSLEKVAGAVPVRQVREARVAVREAQIRLQNTEQTLKNLGFNLRKEAFESLPDKERATRLQFLGLPESVVKSLDPDQTTSNLLPIAASFDGVLLRRDAGLGEMVDAGKPLLEIADLRRMWLKLDVQKEDALKLQLGQRLHFLPDGLPNELESTVTWISTEMNEKTRTLQVRAEVQNPVISSDVTSVQEVSLLRANTFGTGTIDLRQSDLAFVVPISAVIHSDDQPMIFAKVGELSFARVDVKLGIRDEDQVQVESDQLVPGMEIVCRNSHVLKSEWILNHVASTSQ